MDISSLFSLMPVLMKAFKVAQEISSSSKSGTGVIDIIKDKGDDVLDIVTQVGTQLFPNLPKEEQVQAGALRFSPQLVTKIQGQLNKLGANPKLVTDGDYGPRTKAAVTKFQSEHGLDADGWAGPITQAELNKLAGAA